MIFSTNEGTIFSQVVGDVTLLMRNRTMLEHNRSHIVRFCWMRVSCMFNKVNNINYLPWFVMMS